MNTSHIFFLWKICAVVKKLNSFLNKNKNLKNGNELDSVLFRRKIFGQFWLLH